jgi:hypothetical protein
MIGGALSDLINDQLIGQFVFEGCLTADCCMHLLYDELLFEDVPLKVRLNMSQHDSNPPHFSLQVTQYLNWCCESHWFGLGCPHNWPPYLPHLTHLGLYFWDL